MLTAARRSRRDMAPLAGLPCEAAAAPLLSGDDIQRLKGALAELLECKRILDQAR